MSTPQENIDEMLVKKRLPIGMTEFDEWASNIIAGARLPAASDDPETQYDSQKFALASMLMHLGPTVDHECDGYFIKSLRKAAVNQIADAKMKELRDKAKARLKQSAEVTASTGGETSDGEKA